MPKIAGQLKRTLGAKDKTITIIGGGAAGCFAAVLIKRRLPQAEVIIHESQDRLMVKLSRTGGGRCNITNSFENADKISDIYPRGASLMKKAMKEFGPQDTLDFFRELGLDFITQDDGRVFPRTNNAADVVGAIEEEIKRLGVKVVLGSKVDSLTNLDADALLVSCGGLSKNMVKTLESEGVRIIPPAPSLFALKIRDEQLCNLSGITLENTTLTIPGTSYKSTGNLLLTSWGISGPACLKLSSYAALELQQRNYASTLLVNWLSLPEDRIRDILSTLTSRNARKQISSVRPEGVPARLWEHLVNKAGIAEDHLCGDLGKKNLNKLVATLCACEYEICGRTPNKEEFVTCGGVSLDDINSRTMESKTHPGWFFAGEALDIDAVTGGFNLQSAWTTAYLASKGIEEWIQKF